MDAEEKIQRADLVFTVATELMKKHAYTHALMRVEQKLDEILELLRKPDEG